MPHNLTSLFWNNYNQRCIEFNQTEPDEAAEADEALARVFRVKAETHLSGRIAQLQPDRAPVHLYHSCGHRNRVK